MLIAIIITEVFYEVKDTYFTNEVEAMNVIQIQSMILLTITLLTNLWSLGPCGSAGWSSTSESPIAN